MALELDKKHYYVLPKEHIGGKKKKALYPRSPAPVAGNANALALQEESARGREAAAVPFDLE